MSFSAIITAANMAAANATLEAAGFGPGNFSVPVYANTRPGYATLHAWSDAAFQAAVEAIPGVTVSTISGTPAERVADAIDGLGEWGGNAPLLEGSVTPGLYRDDEGALWWVIQAYNANTFPDPTIIPALVRRARIPGEVQPWVQPLDQFDAYLLEDPFTGQPEKVYRVIGGVTRYFKTGINFNTTIPGDPSSGPPFNFWIEIDAEGNEIQPPEPDLLARWVAGGGTLAAGSYNVDVLVVHDRPADSGNDWVFRSTYAGNTQEPGRDGTFDRYWEPISFASEYTP